MLRCDLCSAHDSVLLATKRGVSLRFATDEKQLRGSGRLSRGVRSIALRDGDEVAHTRPHPNPNPNPKPKPKPNPKPNPTPNPNPNPNPSPNPNPNPKPNPNPDP